jgi:hypothetical protein
MNSKSFLFVLIIVSSSFYPNIDAKQLIDESKPSSVFEWATAKPGDFQKWLLNNEKILDQCDACRLLVSWSDEKASTANFNIAEFLVQPSDDRDTKLFIRHLESGVALRIGVNYSPSYLLRNEPFIIRIALAFEGDVDNVFNELSRAQAETLREKNWKYLSLTKEIQIDKKIYSFIFHCENGKTYQKMLRQGLRR